MLESIVTTTTEMAGGITELRFQITERPSKGPMVTVARTTTTAETPALEATLCRGYQRCVSHAAVHANTDEAVAASVAPHIAIKNAGPVHLLNEQEDALVREIITLRLDPIMYAETLAKRIPSVIGKIFWTMSGYPLRLEEGRDVLQDAVDWLRGRPHASTLACPSGLCLAARDHAEEIGSLGLTSDVGTLNMTVDRRATQYGVWNEVIFQLVAFGVTHPMDIVHQLLIGDGVPSRWQRKMLLDKRVSSIGVSIARHAAYGACAVIVLAGPYASKPHEQLVSAHMLRDSLPMWDGKCAVCCQALNPRRCVVAHGGRAYDVHCFTCHLCKSTLRDAYVVCNDRPFCRDCARFRFPLKCAKCGKLAVAPTDETTYEVGGARACEECFLDAAVMLQSGYSRHGASAQKGAVADAT